MTDRNSSSSSKLWLPVSWEERRNSVRIDCQIEVEADLGTRKQAGTLRDLSWQGFRLETRQPVGKGSLVRILSPAVAEKLQCWCTCRWTGGPTPDGSFFSGFEFQEGPLSPTRQWIRHCLKQLGLPESSLSNRRKANRHETDIPVMVLGHGSSAAQTVPGQMADVSLFGARVLLGRPILAPSLRLFLPVGRTGGPVLPIDGQRCGTRLLRDGRFSHHLSWGHDPRQSREIAAWLVQWRAGEQQ